PSERSHARIILNLERCTFAVIEMPKCFFQCISAIDHRAQFVALEGNVVLANSHGAVKRTTFRLDTNDERQNQHQREQENEGRDRDHQVKRTLGATRAEGNRVFYIYNFEIGSRKWNRFRYASQVWRFLRKTNR